MPAATSTSTPRLGGGIPASTHTPTPTVVPPHMPNTGGGGASEMPIHLSPAMATQAVPPPATATAPTSGIGRG